MLIRGNEDRLYSELDVKNIFAISSGVFLLATAALRYLYIALISKISSILRDLIFDVHGYQV